MAPPDDDVRVALAEIKGMVATLSEKVDGQLAKLAGSIEYGDRTNSQAIGFVKDEVKRAHTRVDDLKKEMDAEFDARDQKLDSNRRIAVTSFVGPIVTALIIAVLLYVVGLK